MNLPLHSKSWRALLLAACTSVASAQSTIVFNPVADRVHPRAELAGGFATIRWTGGGQLQRWTGSTWRFLARESPHRERAVDTAFFRVVDPWEGDRSATVHVPASYDQNTPLPLIILLHGYTNTGQEVEDWFKFRPLAESRGFLLAYPNGTIDLVGQEFWNASPACCRGNTPPVDDSGFLRNLIDGTRRRLNVDRKRIYFVGHSNGGFMAHRMACEHADLVAGIASLAGVIDDAAGACQPAEPVHVLQVHGTSDGVIWYDGGFTPWGFYPGALETIDLWADYNGSEGSLITDSSPTINLDDDLPGLDTTVLRRTGGAAAVEHWRIESGGHSPNLKPALTGPSTRFATHVVDWLFAHPKP